MLAAISLASAALVALALRRGLAQRGSRRVPIVEVAAVSAGVGVAVGLGHRVVTATSAGANAGGGLALLTSPVAAVGFIVYLVVRLRPPRGLGHDGPMRN